MPHCNIHIILSNDPELTAFLKANPEAFITDLWAEADVEVHENLRFLVNTFANKQKYVIVTDRKYGMRIQFRVGRYHSTLQVYERNEALTPEEQAQSLNEMERWLKLNLRELCFTPKEIAAMQQAEGKALQP